MKNNRGFILLLTLVMALVMLIVCFVCLKIFLAPYIAIQTDIIKKKEFYMADTAIEVIREQISNIFYDYVNSAKCWETYAGNDQKDYSADCLKQRFVVDVKESSNTIIRDINIIDKYSGKNIFDISKNLYTLPIGYSHRIQISTGNIHTYDNNTKLVQWHKPLTGMAHESEPDNKLSVEAWIEPVKITNDITILTVSRSTNSFYKYVYSGSTDNGHFMDCNVTEDGTVINGSVNNNLFLPKELQQDNNIYLYLTGNLTNDAREYIQDRITRRDFVIKANSTYAGSNIKCTMEYYFTLIALSPKLGDDGSFWNSGQAGEDMTITNIRAIYRLYFRKLNYYWTEG